MPDVPTGVQFVVLGVAAPGGSKRAFLHRTTGKMIVIDAAKRNKPWRAQVAQAAKLAMGNRAPLEGPLTLYVTFALPRPKGHVRPNGVLRASAPKFPTTRPDTTKLLRALEDALTGIVWVDDAQVVTQLVGKRYARVGTPSQAFVDVFSGG